MNLCERDELRRAIQRFQELSTPHRLLELLVEYERLVGKGPQKTKLDHPSDWKEGRPPALPLSRQ